MTLNKLKKKKFKELIALTSAFMIVISNAFPVSYAKDTDVIGEEQLSGGVVAEPYIPENAKIDEEGNVLYDEEGNFILLDEEGNEIPREVLEEYEMSWDVENPIVYDLRETSNKSARSRAAANKVVNLNSASVNIRKTAEIKSGNVLGSLPSGKFAKLEGESGDWFKVKYGNITGYVKKSTVYKLGQAPNAEVKSITGVNIRSSNSASSSKVGYMPEGVTGEAIDVKGNWFKVLYEDTVGWVSKDYVKYTNQSLGKSIKLTSSGLNSKIYFKDGVRNYQHQTSNYIKDESGRNVYCLNSEKYAPNGHPYTRVGKMDNVTYTILKNGYPNKKFTGDNNTDRIITQAALWSHVDKENVKVNNLVAVKNGSTDANMLKYAKNLYNTATSSTKSQEVSFKFSKTALNAKLKGNNFETDYLTMVGTGDIKSSKVTLKAYDVSTGKANTSVKLKDENDKEITQVSVGQKFKVVVPTSVPTGKIKLQATGDLTHEVAVEYSSNLGNIQNAVILEDAIETKNSTNELVVDWDGAGNIKVVKVDSSNKQKLQGAVFVVKNSSGTEVAKLTTNASGEAQTQDLLIGKYTVQEQTSPEGYVLDKTVHNVELTDTTTKTITVENNKIKGSIKIVKKDADNKNKLLKGAEFTLYDANGGVVKKAVTDDKGVVLFEGLAYGKYTVKETAAPQDYVKVDSELAVEIKTNGQVVESEFLNKRAGGVLEFEKTDVATGNIIEGAKIEIKGLEEKNKDIKIEFTSSKGGNRFELPVGKYQFTETVAPEGYVLSKEVGTFEIKANGEVTKAKLTNEMIKGNIKIVKKDANDKDKLLKGAEFTLYDSKGSVVKKAVTDDKGVVLFEGIKYGKYTVKETAAPKDYVKLDSELAVEIKTNGKTIELEFLNRKAGGVLNFEKTDVATGDVIEGAIIEIKGLEEKNKDVVIEFISSKDGNRFELPVGKYQFTEKVAPEGYVLSEEVGTFEIKEDGQVEKANLNNKLIKGNIRILKVDSEDNSKVLEGAVFELINKYGEVLNEVKTDKNGVAQFNNVPFGDYRVKEVKAPEGYEILHVDKDVEIKEDGKTIEVVFVNSKSRGEVLFNKIDSNTGASLEGAKMCILGVGEKNKDIKIEFTSTGVPGQRVQLPVGEYELREIEAPEGYVLNNKPMLFEIEKHNQTIEIEFKNDPIKGSAEILKVDAENEKKVLKGAEFRLYNDAKEEVAVSVTDENGIAKFENLLYGKYYAREIVAPEGYMVTDKVIEINVTKDKEHLKYVFTNQKRVGEVDFTKEDATTGEILEGAEIEIRGLEENNNDVVIEFVSSKEGNRFKLPVGKYQFTEKVAPEGYVLSEEIGTFEIKENGEVVKANLKNTPIIGGVEITKVDSETKEALQGAEFALLDEQYKELAKGTVDEDGVIKFENLRYGSYKIKELVAPQGYVLSEEINNFAIKQNGELVTLTIENTKEPVVMKGSIEITKVDANKKDLVLSGAEFKLYNKNNKELATGVTNEAGKIVFKDLDLGEYYVKETKSPEGYQINENMTKVMVEENGVVVDVTITNAQKLAQTGGNFSSTNMIFIGLVLVGAAIILSEKERRTLK